MVRTPCCDQSTGLMKGTWTPEEDSKLVAYVTKYGCWNWQRVPKFAGLRRCGKSCRFRWMNYLRPDIKRGNYTQQEDDKIIRLRHELGSRWSAIAAYLPGRTDNEIKNRWHTSLKKRFQQNSGTPGKAEFSKPKDQTLSESRQDIRDSVTSSTSTAPTSQIDSVVVDSHVSNTFPMPSTDAGASSSKENLDMGNYDDLTILDAFMEPASENFWTEPYMFDNSYVPNSNEALVPLSPEHEYSAQLWGHNNLHDEYIG